MRVDTLFFDHGIFDGRASAIIGFFLLYGYQMISSEVDHQLDDRLRVSLDSEPQQRPCLKWAFHSEQSSIRRWLAYFDSLIRSGSSDTRVPFAAVCSIKLNTIRHLLSLYRVVLIQGILVRSEPI